MTPPPNALSVFFTLRGRVSRRQYLAAGAGLALFKYTVDAGVAYLTLRTFWSPLDYLNPTLAQRMAEVDRFPSLLLVFLFLWTLPFLWVGVSMSARRAVDAGLSPWIGLGFLVPLLNYVTIAVLALLPGREPRKPSAPRGPRTPPAASVVLSLILACAFVAVGTVAVLTGGMHYYGQGLFVGVPFLLGTVTSYVYNLARPASVPSTVGMATLVLLVGFLLLIALAIEGLVCLVMAFPVMWLTVTPGALFGRYLAQLSLRPDASTYASLGIVLLALPAGAWLDRTVVDPGEREVVTTIEVDAPPEVVWEHVVAFSELPAPDHWIFSTGIAYPLRARIEGEGVGAVRHCEFSTGAFVEPITAWEPPARLAFDVVAQPLPMEEWSFYAGVHPPHLDESFRSVRGEFRLVPLAGGRTRLEGSTWYVLDMGPAAYWKLWGDAILHRIHGRVLRHVKGLAEPAAATGFPGKG